MRTKTSLKLTHNEMILLLQILQKVDPENTAIGDIVAQNHVKSQLEYDATHTIDPLQLRNFEIEVFPDIFEKIFIIIDTQSATGDYWGFSKHIWWRVYSVIWEVSKAFAIQDTSPKHI